jgi:gentisate 1,2-dioxygenase
MAIPNWSWQRHFNASKSAPAILFVMTDSPILEAFGFYREESEDSAQASSSIPTVKLSAAE